MWGFVDILIDYQLVWFGIAFICIFVAFFVLIKKETDRSKQLCAEAVKQGFKVEGKNIKDIKKSPDFCLCAEQIPSSSFVCITNILKGIFNGSDVIIYEHIYTTAPIKGSKVTETVIAFPVFSKTIPDFSLYLQGYIPLAGVLKNVNRIRNSLLTSNGSQIDHIRFVTEPSYLKNYVLLTRDKTKIQSIFNI